MALKGSATIKPETDLEASAATISAGGTITRLTSLAPSAVPLGLLTGVSPFLRSTCWMRMLWIEYQNGIANVVPARSATLLMCGATVMAEPLIWFQATTLAPNLEP